MSTAPKVSLSQDQTSVSIEWQADVQNVNLGAAELDLLIAKLARLRAEIEPTHRAHFIPGQRVAAIPKPHWYTEPDILSGDTLIHLRHPGFGWLSFLIPASDAVRMADYIQAQVEAREQPQLVTRH